MLLGCQLAGGFLATLLDLPVPGPVVGMVLLLVVLQVREPTAGSGLVRVCDGLLRHMQLLFVPAGAGVVQYLGVIGAGLVPILAGLFVGWFATLAATALVAGGLLRMSRRGATR